MWCVSPVKQVEMSLSCSTGAGISVQAGIPDFRSTDGLFKSLKRDNPREALTSGKDLFDASVFNVSSQSRNPFPSLPSRTRRLCQGVDTRPRLLSRSYADL